MKCPKCGYLGFETTDRCRNCQYDFSLAPFSPEPELTLHGDNRSVESPVDLDLPPMKRQTDTSSADALDLDRLFGEPEPAGLKPIRDLEPPASVLDYEPEAREAPVDGPTAEPKPTMAMASEGRARAVAAADGSALPFDDGPLVPPPARPPLSVRRSTPELPRNRPRMTRPLRTEALDFEQASRDKSSAASQAASDTIASLMALPSLAARVAAGAIDVLLLVGIDAVVLYLTLRVTGLENTVDDLRVLPPVPFVGFLAMLAFGYVAAFTVAGGQTIGKMVLSLRVIGDDGRPVDAAGGMIRALACMLVPITLGISYLPALFTSDHRALHDRLAGTRVVQE
jgi:uncharacterized RDD family membrane protein YckC